MSKEDAALNKGKAAAIDVNTFMRSLLELLVESSLSILATLLSLNSCLKKIG